MATPAAQLDQLIASTFDKLKSSVVDQITQKNRVTAALNTSSSVKEDGGLSIRTPVMYALNDTIKSYSGYDVLDTTPQGGLGYIEYQWRLFAGAITISGEEKLKNAGGAAVVNLVKFKLDQFEASMAEELAQWFWATGTVRPDAATRGAKDILSIPDLVGNTGTLGGIDSATDAWWQSYVVPTGTPVDLTALSGVRKIGSIVNSLEIQGSRPDFIFTTQANFEAYEALSTSRVQFQQAKLADLGFTAVAFRGQEVVLEPYVPKFTAGANDGGAMYFLNSKNVQFYQHSNRWMDRTEFMRPVDQDAETMQVLSMGNLATDCRRAHGVIKATVV